MTILDYKAEGIGAAISYLMGGGSLRIFSPLEVKEYTFSMAPVPDIVALGAALTSIYANGSERRVIYIQQLNERLHELFGFGVTREGNFIVLKRPGYNDVKPNTGFGYTTDDKGRMMIDGDYAREVDRAYMMLLTEPALVLSAESEHPYIYNNTANIYLSDLRAAAEYCGDSLVIEGNSVRIVAPQES